MTFAINRRRQGGPVDQTLPLLRVTDPDGKLRAVWVRYACHNVTLLPPFNKIHGDWAGDAQAVIERNHPGVVTIGCSGDAKPKPQGSLPFARMHGNEIAHEVDRLLAGAFKPVRGPLTARQEAIALPFDRLPTKQEWIERSKSRHKATAYHARVQLDRLKRGEKLDTKLSYQVQVWTFGHDLAMVFLADEVVGDYTVRLNREFDRTRLWINAYSNDISCYIPSEQVLKEGGHEAGRSMLYYDHPIQFAAGLEDKIVNTVGRLLPHEFYSAEKQREFPPPKSPAEAVLSLRTKPGLKIELVAAVLKRVEDSEITVRHQLALSLGEWDDARAGRVLIQLAQQEGADKDISAAVLSSALPHLTALVSGLLDEKKAARQSSALLLVLIRMAIAVRNEEAIVQVLEKAILPRKNGKILKKSFTVLATMLESFERRKQTLEKLYRRSGPTLKTAITNLSVVFAAARRTVVNETVAGGTARRLAALTLLGRGRTHRDDDRKLLSRLTATEQPIAVQLAAVSVLGRLRDRQVPTILLSEWRGRGPQIRSAILDVLLRRPQWTLALFDAIERGDIRAAEIGASRRNLLSAHTNPQIRQRAQKLLAASVDANRQKVLAIYDKALSLSGEPERGHKVFAKVCENCHHFRGSGKKVGPDLDAITNRSPRALLISLLDPNRAVEGKYLSYAAVTTDGRVFTGRLGNQNTGKYNNSAVKENRRLLTERMYQAMVTAGKFLKPRPIETVSWRTKDILPVANPAFSIPALQRQIADKSKRVVQRNRPAFTLAWLRRLKRKIPLTLSALHVNNITLLHLPGEAFVEYQLRAQALHPRRFVATAAYGDSGPWYIPTAEAHTQGGYEVREAFCDPQIDPQLTTGIQKLFPPERKPT